MEPKIRQKVFDIVLKAWTKLDLLCKAYDVNDDVFEITAALQAYMLTEGMPERKDHENH